MDKVVIIGVDGVTPDLVEKWMEEGHLPNFQKIKNKGAYSRLNSTTPPFSAPSWTSIITGCNQGKHGIYGFESTEFIKTHLITSKNRKVPAIWNYLSDMGMSNIVVNVPGTYPPDKINGVMITGLLTPSPESNFTYPKEIRNRLLKGEFGEYELESIWLEDLPRSYMAKNDPEKLLDILLKQIESRANVTIKLMKSMKWDFTMVVLRATDTAQHFLFHNKELLLKMYKKTDELVGKIIETEPNATYFIVSDHGFQMIKKIMHPDNLLYTNGYLKPMKEPRKNYMFLINQFFYSISRSILSILPPEKIKHSSLIKNLLFSAASKEKVYDLTKTIAFCISEGRGIQINLKNRYEQGIIDKKDYEKHRTELINLFESLRDPWSGKRYVKKAYRGNEIYGENAIHPLDIVLDLEPGYSSCEGLRLSHKFFDSLRFQLRKDALPHLFKDDTSSRSGDHAQYGIFFACGSNIKKTDDIKDISVFDIVPQVFAAYSIKPPENLDGIVHDEIFIKKPVFKKVVRQENKKLTIEEKMKILKIQDKLKKLNK